MELGPVAARIAALLRSRSVRVALLVATGLGAATPLVPLCNVPGYESALAMNLLVALLGGLMGIAAVRQERAVELGMASLPGVARSPAPFTAVARATLAALALALAGVAPVLVAALIAGAVGAACSLTAGLAWYPVLVLPSAALAAALGVLCGALVRSRRVAGALYLGLVLISLAASLEPVVAGPQVYVYSHLLGYLPGPLYDEVLSLGAPLLGYRALTVAWAALAIGAVALTWQRGRLGRPSVRLVALALTSAAGIAVVLGWALRTEIGYEHTRASIAERLGGHTEGDRCSLVHPREMKIADVRRTVRECDLRVRQLESFFGVNAPRLTVYLYRSEAEKQSLVGAGGTQFAKPWQLELHIDARGYPHPVLKHELAHLVAARLGRAPFGITAALGGLLPVQGLVEGAAVAADWPAGELTVHEQVRAMRELGLAPDLPRIVSAWGFYGEPARRAYTYAGSFVRYLVDTRGRERFARVYRDGDFEAAYGASLPALMKDWEAFLAGIPLSDRGRELAERRFRRPAIFRRPCAREVAELRAEGDDALRAEDAAKAAERYGRCAALDPGDPGLLRDLAEALARRGEVDRVRAIAAQVMEHPGADEVLRGQVLALVGDAAVENGDLIGAMADYLEAAKHWLDDAGARALAIKIQALDDPDVAGAVLPYLADGDDARLFAVRDLLERKPEYATGWYLLGRRLLARDQHELAAQYLERALSGPLPTPAVEREAHRLHALALMATPRAAEACDELAALAMGAEAGPRLQAEDLLELCRHEAGARTARR